MQSQRCPNKMLRTFGGTTLTDIVLDKLAAVARHGTPTFFAGHEEAFAVKAREHNVRFVPRSLRSATIDGPIAEILGFLDDVDFDWVLLVSACSPFLTADMILRFIRDRGGQGRPAFSVRRHRHHFVDAERRGVNFDITQKTLNTKTVRPLFELVDGLYLFDRRFFLTEGRYWDWAAVEFVEVGGGYDLLDVDTEEDFAIAEALWKAR